MQTLHVVTHPEATHHVDRRVGGWYDSELTDRGREQASAIAAHLRTLIPAGERVDLVSSDLRRTAQTAAVISDALGITVRSDPDLREKSYGDAEGRSQEWLDERFVFPPATGNRLDHDEGIPGGETKRQGIERAYAAVARFDTITPQRIVVTHGGTANWVITAWLKIPVMACTHVAFRLPSGSVTTLVSDDRFHNRTLTTLGYQPYVRIS